MSEAHPEHGTEPIALLTEPESIGDHSGFVAGDRICEELPHDASPYPTLRHGHIVQCHDRPGMSPNYGKIIEDLGDRCLISFLKGRAGQADVWISKSMLRERSGAPLGSSSTEFEPPIDIAGLLRTARGLIEATAEEFFGSEDLFKDIAKIIESEAFTEIREMVRDAKKEKRPGFTLGEFDSRVTAAKKILKSIRKANRKASRSLTMPGPPNGSGNATQDDKRSIVVITTKQDEVADEVIAILANDPTVYYRGTTLAEIVENDESIELNIFRPQGSFRIARMCRDRIRYVVSRNVAFVRLSIDPETGEEFSIPVNPPQWCINLIEAMGRWPGIRPLFGATQTPILRPDGSILSIPGYDPATGLFYSPSGEFLDVPSNPIQDDARTAAHELFELVGDFPFMDDNHKAAWLSGLLTPFARFAIYGPVPLHYFDANLRGTGKSKLTDLIAVAMTGRSMPRMTYTEDDNELRKRITSIALAGDLLMMFDNVDAPFGGASLDAVLTAMTWKDRILHESAMTPELPWVTCIYATGNNSDIKGDIARRIVLSRIVTADEHPEERKNFTIQGDLIEHAKRIRPKLVAAALTLLRAYRVAGYPTNDLTEMGSFGESSKVVRSAIHWATGLDPCGGIAYLRENEPATLTRAALIEGWAELPNSTNGITAAEALELVRWDKVFAPPPEYSTLREVFRSWNRNGDLPTSHTIGMKLRAIKGCNIKGFRLIPVDAGKHTAAWRVERVPVGAGGPSGGVGALSPTLRTDSEK